MEGFCNGEKHGKIKSNLEEFIKTWKNVNKEKPLKELCEYEIGFRDGTIATITTLEYILKEYK